MFLLIRNDVYLFKAAERKWPTLVRRRVNPNSSICWIEERFLVFCADWILNFQSGYVLQMSCIVFTSFSRAAHNSGQIYSNSMGFEVSHNFDNEFTLSQLREFYYFCSYFVHCLIFFGVFGEPRGSEYIQECGRARITMTANLQSFRRLVKNRPLILFIVTLSKRAVAHTKRAAQLFIYS